MTRLGVAKTKHTVPVSRPVLHAHSKSVPKILTRAFFYAQTVHWKHKNTKFSL